MHLQLMEQPETAVWNELNELLDELRRARHIYGPAKEDLEEDDDAWLLLTIIDSQQPVEVHEICEVIRLLAYFLMEYGWHEDEQLQLQMEQLISRASVLFPKPKRFRRSFRAWLHSIAGQTRTDVSSSEKPIAM